MAKEGLPDLHVTRFNVHAGIRRGGLGSNCCAAVPLIALERRPHPDAAEESLWLRLPVKVARDLAAELIEEADRAEQLARKRSLTELARGVSSAAPGPGDWHALQSASTLSLVHCSPPRSASPTSRQLQEVSLG
ncbi:hypothetical protein ACGFIF_17250 [Kribbella sp. NPDC049174]|uniref:hypothetical protein n=1 Tax=Kribbella sp. NPDC049174 TaxID=3364112 RepID=UPI00370F7C53